MESFARSQPTRSVWLELKSQATVNSFTRQTGRVGKLGPNAAVAVKLGTPRQVVSKWRKRFFELRLAGFETLRQKGKEAVPGLQAADA